MLRVRRLALLAVFAVALTTAAALPAGAGAAGTHSCLRTDVPIAMTYSTTHTTCAVGKPVALAAGAKTLAGRRHYTVTVKHRRWTCRSDGSTSLRCTHGAAKVYGIFN
jgi:hypothetical protein